MRKLIVLLFLGLLLYPVGSMASVYGILKGNVTGEDGKSLPRATVKVEGTSLGALVKVDGSYIVVSIPAGQYTIIYSYVGLQPVKKQVTISADQSAVIDVVLRSDASTSIRTKELNVVAQKMVNSETVGRLNNISKDKIQGTAREGLSGVISLTSGVINSGNGFSIRGSRPEETLMMVDGINISNQTSGGFGASGSYYYPMVSSYAIEESQVITGGFSAEYGDATGGVVNSSIQTGKLDRYDGWIRWRTDVPSLFGRQSTDTKIVREGSRLKAVESGEGAQVLGSDENIFEFGTGGPIPFIENSTYYLSGKYLFEKYGKGYDIQDPWGYNLGHMPDDRTWSRNITPKFTFGLSKAISLTVGASYGVASFEGSGWGWLYNNTEGWVYDKMADGSFKQVFNDDGTPKTNGIPERIEKQDVTDQYVTNFNALIKHTFESSFYEIRIGYSQNNDATARRVGWKDPSFFTGFEMKEPTDNYRIEKGQLVPGSDKIIDEYSLLNQISYTKDGYLRLDIPQRNPLTGYFEGPSNSTGTNNPWGLQGQVAGFATSGGGGFSFRDQTQITIDGSYTDIFKTGEFNHTLKTGFLLTLFELNRSYNGAPYDGNPFFDVYTDGRWGGNLYADDEAIKNKTNEPKKPTKLGVFVMDQVKYKDILITGGLRLDYFNPNSKYRTSTTEFVSIKADTGFADAKPKIQVSPRINIAYPLTESSNLRISYGMFFQMPLFQYMYDNFNVDVLRPGSPLGNPNIEAQRTNQYEIAYENQLNETFSISINSYYKDIYNQVGVLFIPTVPDAYYQYTVAEYGSSRGVELGFSKAPADNYSFDLNYSLASVTGTSPNPSSNFNVSKDPYTTKLTFPLAEYPMPLDIRHYFKGNLRFYWNKDQGPSIGGIKLLENTDIVFTNVFRTGTPYTRSDRNGKAIAEINAERQPSIWSLDAKISKSFFLKDIFGDNAGQNSTVEFYMQINNVLNRTAAVGVYSTTGDPLDDGRTFDRQVGDFNPTSFFKEASLDNPATFSSSQYDSYGNRLYSEMADFDKNGIVTQAETYESYFNFVETLLKFRGNFQAPRIVYFGIMFRF
jgi:outer membrane receptor protein involved in Fe transport